MTLFAIKGVREMGFAQASVVTIVLKMARATAAKENKTKRNMFFGLYFFFFCPEEYCSYYHNVGPSLQSLLALLFLPSSTQNALCFNND